MSEEDAIYMRDLEEALGAIVCAMEAHAERGHYPDDVHGEAELVAWVSEVADKVLP